MAVLYLLQHESTCGMNVRSVWKQSFGYDPIGHCLFDQTPTMTVSNHDSTSRYRSLVPGHRSLIATKVAIDSRYPFFRRGKALPPFGIEFRRGLRGQDFCFGFPLGH